MKRLVILGSTGMLGSEISRVARESDLPVLEISRRRGVLFDVERMQFDSLARQLELTREDWLVNCIGWIPQKTSGSAQADQDRAKSLNARLPDQISDSKKRFGFNWIQIATDCVFSGKTGGYSEESPLDAEDLYGKSKIQGEAASQGDIRIRCSIVGPDKGSAAGLYEWFRSQRDSSTVQGFTNHVWNGVSTSAFANLVIGLFKNDQKESLIHHWIPSDTVTKYELLQTLEKYLRFGVEIEPFEVARSVNRTLATTNPDRNLWLWELSGYRKTPNIDTLCRELVAIDRQRG